MNKKKEIHFPHHAMSKKLEICLSHLVSPNTEVALLRSTKKKKTYILNLMHFLQDVEPSGNYTCSTDPV